MLKSNDARRRNVKAVCPVCRRVLYSISSGENRSSSDYRCTLDRCVFNEPDIKFKAVDYDDGFEFENYPK